MPTAIPFWRRFRPRTGAGSGAAHDRAIETLLTQLLHGPAGSIHRTADQGLPFGHRAFVLRTALIGLQASENQMF